MDESRIQRALRQGPPFRTAYEPRPLPLDVSVVVRSPGLGAMRLVLLVVLTGLVIAGSLAALTVGGFLRPPIREVAPRPIAQHPADAWTEAAGLAVGRRDHTATLLADGEVLVVGGATTLNSDPTASAELYQPSTRAWIPGPPAPDAFIGHTATLLGDGRVLAVGGWSSGADVYDPVARSWRAGNPPLATLIGHTATLLRDGRVLVAGGKGAIASAELYDPATGAWQLTGTMVEGRTHHTATLLPDGRVLVVGGNGVFSELANAELYDPLSGTWSMAAAPPRTLLGHTATLLVDGTVLVTGGWHSDNGRIERSAMIYDPATDAWAPAPDLLEARGGHTATLLADGRVLVAGGFSDGSKDCGEILATAELYDPVLGSWSRAQPMASERYAQVATPLADGTVLVTGGSDSGCMVDPLGSAELYGAAPPVN